jgi:hypothetical protein
MKHVLLYDAWLNEGVRKTGTSYEFDWMTDLPEDLMSLKFKKYRGRTVKMSGSDMTYTYYYAYQIKKSDNSTDLLYAIKTLEDSVDPKDLMMFINKAVMGFDSTFGTSNYNAIIAPKSSSTILDAIVDQMSAKSGASQVFSDAFVKAASTDIKLDMEAVNKLPEKTRKDVEKAFKKATDPSKPFKIKEVWSPHRKFFKDFMLFNSENDRRFYNAVEGQKVILVDDYRTSGTTLKEMLDKLSEAGAAEVAVFILIKVGEK